MGKTRTKRHTAKKKAPTGLKSVRDAAKDEDEGIGANGDGLAHDAASQMASVIEKLQSAEVKTKECGCFDVSSLMEEPESIPYLLQHDVVRVMAPLLVDMSYVVRHAAAGTLRNLSVCGGADVCDAMVAQDVLTPLVALLKQYSDRSWSPSKNKKKKNSKSDSAKGEILEEATHLLWNLCENNNTAVTIFNREDLLSVLMQYTDPAVYSKDLIIAIVQCVHTVSEDNPEAVHDLAQPVMLEPVLKLLALKTTEDVAAAAFDTLLIRTLAAGILYNVHDGNMSAASASDVFGIVEALSTSLKVEAVEPVTELATKLNKAQQRGGDDYDRHTDQETGVTQKNVDHLLSAQIFALEILTNLCCTKDGNDSDGEADDSGDSREEFFSQDKMECCDDTVREKTPPPAIPPEIHEAILSRSLGKQVLKTVAPFPSEVCVQLRSAGGAGQKALKRLCALQCRSLLCLHNLASCFDLEELGGAEHVYSVWKQLAQLAFRHTYVCPADTPNPNYCNTPEHTELLEAVTTAMRGVVRKLTQVRTLLCQDLTPSDLQLMCQVAELCTETSVRVNIVSILGTFGNHLSTLLMDDAGCAFRLKDIGLFLLELCGKDTEMGVVSEALDAIIDVFAEDHTDGVAREIHLVERLQRILPSFKNKIKSQRKHLGERYCEVVNVKMNVIGFIQYKTTNQTTNGH